MVELDLIHTPLCGDRLIEASAGTGKTHTIVGLYLRLIVELGLTVDQILVVTYTNAATEELKTRIRSKLRRAQQGFHHGSSPDPLIDALVRHCPDRRHPTAMIEAALTDFDRAAIFTIHGFCQRILQEHAFETGNLYDTELVPDSSALLQEVSEDFWRTRLTGAAPELVRFLVAHKGLKTPAAFQQLTQGIGAIEYDIIPDLDPPDLSGLAGYRRSLRRFGREWQTSRAAATALLKDPGLNARNYGRPPDDREMKVAALAAAMDRFVDPRRSGFPLFEEFEKFTTAYINSKTKKNFQPPQHPFFDAAERLAQQAAELMETMERYELYLKRTYFDFVRTEMVHRKQSGNIQFYDDLLSKVKETLERGGGAGAALIKAVRNRFKAALVDEFQDTDPIQYIILSRFFSEPQVPFFTIGDPKQSIYSFRGADIFSYLAASDRAESKYTLYKNWRSEPAMIRAVNHLFGNARHPFLFEEIVFKAGEAGNPSDDRKHPSLPALSLWYLPGAGDRPVNKSDAVTAICEAVADEIAHIISEPNPTAVPGDIAVLVRTHRQAQQIKENLSRRKVPAVLHGAGNIFDSHEAEEFQRLLSGIAENTREEKFRTALATDMLGVSGAVLGTADAEPHVLEEYRYRFREYYQEWKVYGFIRMFRRLMAREGVRARLLAFADGERRLTNVTHLAEILHRRSIEGHLGLTALLKWLMEQRRPETQRVDEHQLRLESDARAVRIVTIHKSKGLEYPVVFCPFAFESATLRSDGKILFHDTASAGRLTLDLGSADRPAHMQAAQHELLGENLRLLYVALTRAKKRCYLAWGRINTAETSALAYLLHCPEAAAAADVVNALKEQMAAKKDGDLRDDLQRLAERSYGAIEIAELPIRPFCMYRPAPLESERMTCRVFNGTIDRHWTISSYSSLVSRVAADPETVIIDEAVAGLSAPAPFQPIGPAGSEGGGLAGEITRFPKGTRAGIFFHDLLEEIDFTTRIDTEPIDRKLREYGFDPGWGETVARTVDEIVSLALPGNDSHLRLCEVAKSARVNEMEFYFPLNAIDPKRLRESFEGCLPGFDARDVAAAMQQLSFAKHRGFFKGYIDLVFEHAQRFYLLDWKSNFLGERLEDYRRENLAAAMVSHFYHLQYTLYTLAANRFLRQRVPGYRYETHFGGVFYVFIRGVRSEFGNRYGVFYDLPDPECINALDRRLIPPSH